MIMRNRAQIFCRLSAVVAIAAAAGCSGGGDDLPRVAVSGTVTMDGQPLPEGLIQFIPEGADPEKAASASGTIKEGAFAIDRASGPTAGKYKVAINRPEHMSEHVKIELKKRGRRKAPPGQKDLVPERYNSKTGLHEDIPSGGTSTLKYELQSK